MPASGGSERRFGRPTKLSHDLIDLMASFVHDGDPPTVAAALVGISRSTHYSWTQRGNAQRTSLQAGENLSKADELYVDFVETLEAAAAAHEAGLVQVIHREALDKNNWKAAAWMLER